MGKHIRKISFLILACLLLGTFLLQPSGSGQGEMQTAEGLKVQAITVVPRLAAYGQARPSRVWAAVPQSNGRLMWVSPKIDRGEYVEKGEELLRLTELNPTPDQEGTALIIRAPFRGLASNLEFQPGQTVASGQTILTLDSIDKVEITIGLNSEKMAMLADMDQPADKLAAELLSNLAQAWVEVTPEGGAEKQPARLSSRPLAVKPGGGLVEASLVVDNPSAPDAIHHVFISAPPKERQVVIPRQAVHEGEVFVVDEKMRLKKRPVTIKYTLENYAVIGRGLEPGETLVIGDVGTLKPGGLMDVRLNSQFYLTAENELGPTQRLEPHSNAATLRRAAARISG